MSNTAKWYIEHNDLNGAVNRLNNARKNWVEHWYSTCETIYKASKEWAKEYILDPINKAVIKIKECIKKVKTQTQKTSHTYLIKMYNILDEWTYTKIGKAEVLKNRFRQLIGHTYKDGQTISRIEIVKEYELPDDDSAQILESLMRRYFRKTKEFIPNDRFKPFEPTEKDLEVFEQYYNLVLAN